MVERSYTHGRNVLTANSASVSSGTAPIPYLEGFGHGSISTSESSMVQAVWLPGYIPAYLIHKAEARWMKEVFHTLRTTDWTKYAFAEGAD